MRVSTKRSTVPANFHFYDLAPAPTDVAREVREGLAQEPKMLPPKLLYDERGAELFVQILEQPEYYVPDRERAIMAEHLPAICAELGERVRILEPGAGDCAKIRPLLGHCSQVEVYVPLEISGEMLQTTAQEVAEAFPEVAVHAVCADYLSGLQWPAELPGAELTTVLFMPGSSIGNYPREEAQAVLRWFRQLVGPQGKLLIGVDTLKSPELLIPAYDDAAGVTAAFSMNVLHRLRNELGIDLDPNDFHHEAIFNEAKSCIEMRVVADRHVRFRFEGRTYDIPAGDYIHTESSYKYPPEAFGELAHKAGFGHQRVWTDPEEMFAVHLFDAK